MAANDKGKRERAISFNGLLDKFACMEESPSSRSRPTTPSPTKSSLPGTPTSSLSPSDMSASSSHLSSASKISKKRKVPRRYAPPAQYAHLAPVADCLAADLICVFIGLNPGIMTSQKQHMFANPTNLFWPLLFESGCVGRRLTCVDDRRLPMDWNLGITNLISRTTAEQSELSKDEMVHSAGELESKLRRFRPSAICVVGKGIWEAIYRYKAGKSLKQDQFKFGWQDMDEIRFGAQASGCPKVFVVPSTSGRVAAYSRTMKAELWKDLGQYVRTVRHTHQL
ncbi:uracil-DNA glycosylase-like protein [Lipomyces orientalis]|uniref:Uracil-DNA glycosylase-like protein n=1 Tax=Lipomyces orientalis TaxID=1233043 RepID=A0ACC3TN29_9ASCO